jgi:hypothetical protein
MAKEQAFKSSVGMTEELRLNLSNPDRTNDHIASKSHQG